MPYKEKPIQKSYYKISEVAEMLSVNTSLIRFWEKEFDSIKPIKNKKGIRLFTPEDIEILKKIYHLVKDKGYTLQGAKDVLKNKRVETMENTDAIHALNKVKDFLLEVKKQL